MVCYNNIKSYIKWNLFSINIGMFFLCMYNLKFQRRAMRSWTNIKKIYVIIFVCEFQVLSANGLFIWSSHSQSFLISYRFHFVLVKKTMSIPFCVEKYKMWKNAHDFFLCLFYDYIPLWRMFNGSTNSSLVNQSISFSSGIIFFSSSKESVDELRV